MDNLGDPVAGSAGPDIESWVSAFRVPRADTMELPPHHPHCPVAVRRTRTDISWRCSVSRTASSLTTVSTSVTWSPG